MRVELVERDRAEHRSDDLLDLPSVLGDGLRGPSSALAEAEPFFEEGSEGDSRTGEASGLDLGGKLRQGEARLGDLRSVDDARGVPNSVCGRIPTNEDSNLEPIRADPADSSLDLLGIRLACHEADSRRIWRNCWDEVGMERGERGESPSALP